MISRALSDKKWKFATLRHRLQKPISVLFIHDHACSIKAKRTYYSFTQSVLVQCSKRELLCLTRSLARNKFEILLQIILIFSI